MKLQKLSSIILLSFISLFLFSCEGEVAETDADIIAKIAQEWTVVEGAGAGYEVVIETGAGDNGIVINNFNDNDEGFSVTAIVSGLNITIKAQDYDTREGDNYIREVYGTGLISGDYTTISFSYNFNDGSSIEGDDIVASATVYDEAVKSAEKVQ